MYNTNVIFLLVCPMLDEQRIRKILKDENEPDFRLKQLKKWVYQQGELDFACMTDLPSSLQIALKDSISCLSLREIKQKKSNDGQTSKYALETKDGLTIEIVVLRYLTGRVALCISSQIGCAIGCPFCATGQMGFVRDLSAEEICDQVLFARSVLMKEKDDEVGRVLPANVIIMGMGEPFLNYDNTLGALRLIQSEFGIGGRRLTVSTVGIVPGIRRFAEENLQNNLAVSLHTVDDELRNQLVPINKKYNLNLLKEAILDYIDKTKRKVFFEYVMLKDLNDSHKQAQALAAWLPKGLAHVNLIRFNRIAGLGFEPSTKKAIQEFQSVLEKANVPATIRHPMGDDIEAGCGQLASK